MRQKSYLYFKSTELNLCVRVYPPQKNCAIKKLLLGTHKHNVHTVKENLKVLILRNVIPDYTEKNFTEVLWFYMVI